MASNRLFATLLVLACSATVLGEQPQALLPGIRAEVRPYSNYIPLGQPVWARFYLENVKDEPITLTVPGLRPAIPTPEAGLPLSHLFSGGTSPALTISTTSGRNWDQPLGFRAPAEAPLVIVAGKSSVGATIDLREYFPALRGAGQYRITWLPYGGAVRSDPVVITVSPLKQATIVTDDGSMTIRFFYADAPNHVANFLELAASGFYDGKTFHRLEPGYLLQGGCPRGDGSGIRLDGKRIPAEFNSQEMRKGTVAMALLDDDPESASCQFFICNTRQKEWDGVYTVFGELVGEESYTTLDRIMETPVDEFGRPVKPLAMRSIRIMDAPPDAVP